MNVTDDRQTTDGRATANSEREREFTFAKNKCISNATETTGSCDVAIVTTT